MKMTDPTSLPPASLSFPSSRSISSLAHHLFIHSLCCLPSPSDHSHSSLTPIDLSPLSAHFDSLSSSISIFRLIMLNSLIMMLRFSTRFAKFWSVCCMIGMTCSTLLFLYYLIFMCIFGIADCFHDSPLSVIDYFFFPMRYRTI